MSDYVVFDMEYLLELYSAVRSSVGAISSVAFYTLLLIASVYMVADIIRRFS